MASPGVDLIDQDHYASQGPPHATLPPPARRRARLLARDARRHGLLGDHEVQGHLRRLARPEDVLLGARGRHPAHLEGGASTSRRRACSSTSTRPSTRSYRRLVSLGFSGRMIRRLEEHVRDITTEHHRPGRAGRASATSSPSISAELPLRVIVELVGVPLADRHRVLEWSNQMLGYDDPEYQLDPDDAEDRRRRALHVRQRAGRRAHRAPARRPGERADARRGRRRAARRSRSSTRSSCCCSSPATRPRAT